MTKILKKARFLRGMTQHQLASLSGLHQSTISLIESGAITPNEDQIKKITKALYPMKKMY